MSETQGKALFNPFVDEAKWDLSTLTYEAWLDLIFQHPVRVEEETNWYWEDEWEYKISDNQIVFGYLSKLFFDSRILVERYRDEQLEQGFWFLLGPAGFSDVFWDQNIDRERRTAAIRSQAILFKELFAEHPLDTSVNMWWDLFENGYYCDHQPVDDDDAAIQEAILWTLGDILGMPEWHCVGSALHGLNHLHHPRVPEFIDYFLATKQGLDEEWIAYALLCREGKAL